MGKRRNQSNATGDKVAASTLKAKPKSLSLLFSLNIPRRGFCCQDLQRPGSPARVQGTRSRKNDVTPEYTERCTLNRSLEFTPDNPIVVQVPRGPKSKCKYAVRQDNDSILMKFGEEETGIGCIWRAYAESHQLRSHLQQGLQCYCPEI